MAQLVGSEDSSERNIVLCFPSKRDPSIHPRESTVRAIWFVLHAVLEDVGRHKRMDDASSQSILVVQKLPLRSEATSNSNGYIQGRLPLRISLFQVHRPTAFSSVVWNIVKYLMRVRLRQRVRVQPRIVEGSFARAWKRSGFLRVYYRRI